MSKAREYIDSLTAKGEISFTVKQYCDDVKVSYKAAINAFEHLRQKKEIVSPSKGYYLILPPEFRQQGCLPAEFFIDDLMQHWNMDYYICLLSAALYHGAAHHQPQMFQVMLNKKKESCHCGDIVIDFIQNNDILNTPVQQLKTRTGYVKVSTPEATAMDMLKYIRQSGGIGRIATVLDELTESMSVNALTQLASQSKEQTWVHRLGFILDKLGHITLAESLYRTLDKNRVNIIPLVPHTSITGAARNKKWRIAINANIESDIHDTD